MREDYAETIKNAILAIRGVADVIPAAYTAEYYCGGSPRSP